MRVFVLGTGRCGTVTLYRALSHATNYTVGHESRANQLVSRLDYPDNHIEVDGRLSWFCGSLYERYPDAWYVHLKRERETCVPSLMGHRPKNFPSMLRAFGNGVVMAGNNFDQRAAAELIYDTVHDNIRLLSGITGVWPIRMENMEQQGVDLWHCLHLEGDLEAARAELLIKHNPGRSA